MPVTLRGPLRIGIAVVALTALVTAAAAGTGPFGVGLPEPAPSAGGFLPDLFRAIAAWQSAFYRDMTAMLRAMKDDGSAGFWLAGAAFLYGVLHAAGPGHGKAVVSAWVLANRETARNGAILAMVSALAQGVTAVVLVGIAAMLLGATSIAMTRAAAMMEVGSFAIIAGLGVWLVWRKILKPLGAAWAERYAPVEVTSWAVAGPAGIAGDWSSTAQHRHGDHDHGHAHGHGHRLHGHRHADHDHVHAHHHGHDHHHHHAHPHGHDHEHHHASARDHAHRHDDHAHHAHDHGHHAHGGPGLVCEHGHVHGATPAIAAGPLNWRKTWATVLAVGARPCTGALIVLVFALSQGLLWAGVAATFAMAIGTGLTVALLTIGAVTARGLALRFAGGAETPLARRVHVGFEAAGAVAVLLFGLLMLGASLYG